MILDKSVDVKRTVATFISVDLKNKNILETVYTGLFFFLNNCKVGPSSCPLAEKFAQISKIYIFAESLHYGQNPRRDHHHVLFHQ